MVVLIIQARMGSTRLPGKVLMPIGGRPMLSHQLDRLRHCRRVDRIVIATTVKPADDPIVSFCEAEGIACTRGSEQDVLSRYAEAAARFDATTVVRVTSDCPLLDPALVDEVIAALDDDTDYASNMIQPTWPYGMAVEVMRRSVLDEAAAEAVAPEEREHVTPFIYWRPERYRLKSVTTSPDLSKHRWTVDTPEDFELVSRLIGAVADANAGHGVADVFAVLNAHPEWENLNRHVVQKTVTSTTKGK